MVLGVCRRVLRDHHDAEEAFQATFLVLARKAASIRPPEMLPNWLHGVARQTAVKARAINGRRRARRQVSIMPEPQTLPALPTDDLSAWLDGELSRLPARYRLPVILCELEGLGHREAALRLGWPVGTVSGRLSRARAILAGRLTRRDRVIPAGALAVAFGSRVGPDRRAQPSHQADDRGGRPFHRRACDGDGDDLRPGRGPHEPSSGRDDDLQADRDDLRRPGRWNAPVGGRRGAPYPGRTRSPRCGAALECVPPAAPTSPSRKIRRRRRRDACRGPGKAWNSSSRARKPADSSRETSS